MKSQVNLLPPQPGCPGNGALPVPTAKTEKVVPQTNRDSSWELGAGVAGRDAQGSTRLCLPAQHTELELLSHCPAHSTAALHKAPPAKPGKNNSLILVQWCMAWFGKAISEHNDLGRLWSAKLRKKQQGQAGTCRCLTNGAVTAYIEATVMSDMETQEDLQKQKPQCRQEDNYEKESARFIWNQVSCEAHSLITSLHC